MRRQDKAKAVARHAHQHNDVPFEEEVVVGLVLDLGGSGGVPVYVHGREKWEGGREEAMSGGVRRLVAVAKGKVAKAKAVQYQTTLHNYTDTSKGP